MKSRAIGCRLWASRLMIASSAILMTILVKSQEAERSSKPARGTVGTNGLVTN